MDIILTFDSYTPSVNLLIINVKCVNNINYFKNNVIIDNTNSRNFAA